MFSLPTLRTTSFLRTRSLLHNKPYCLSSFRFFCSKDDADLTIPEELSENDQPKETSIDVSETPSEAHAKPSLKFSDWLQGLAEQDNIDISNELKDIQDIDDLVANPEVDDIESEQIEKLNIRASFDQLQKGLTEPVNLTPRRKKRKQIPNPIQKFRFVRGELREYVHTQQQLYPTAEVVHLYERRVMWHKRYKEWQENQTFKLLRRKEREAQHRNVEGQYRAWRENAKEDNFKRWKAYQNLRLEARVEALKILKKADNLWERYPDELQDLKYDIRRASRPYFTRYN